MKNKAGKAKEFNFRFRKTYSCSIHGTVLAKTEKEAEKKLRKFAKTVYPEDFSDDIDASYDFDKLDDGDDFCVYSEGRRAMKEFKCYSCGEELSFEQATRINAKGNLQCPFCRSKDVDENEAESEDENE